jgi:mevalonate kinase
VGSKAPAGRIVEATAPGRLDLGGGSLSSWPLGLRPAGARAVAAAVDRRASCRVETVDGPLLVESRDTLPGLRAEAVDAIPAQGVFAAARRVLRRLGVDAGLRVTLQSRVPAAAGLGGVSLGLAAAAALARVSGRGGSAEELWDLLKPEDPSADDGPTPIDFAASYHGGVVRGAVAGSVLAGVERLEVDPARVEECVLLVDPESAGPAERPADGAAVVLPGDEQVRALLVATAAAAEATASALAGARWTEAGRSVAEEMALRLRLGGPAHLPAAVGRIVEVAAGHGAGARPCGPGLGGLVLVWAPPGERGPGAREAVAKVLQAEGFRSFPARPDLRGLEVESEA